MRRCRERDEGMETVRCYVIVRGDREAVSQMDSVIARYHRSPGFDQAEVGTMMVRVGEGVREEGGEKVERCRKMVRQRVFHAL